MSDKTNIDYCDHTWSPWQGCSPVSPGCGRCYMLALMKRWGKDGTKRTLTKDWKKPRRWNRQSAKCQQFCDEQPKPRVLVSMCDPFDDTVPDEWFSRFLELIQDTPNLNWLVLTKRPHLKGKIDFSGFPNVWLGVSAENQQIADERIPILLSIPAKMRFVSVEPILGPVDLRKHLWVGDEGGYEYVGSRRQMLHLVIVGGESGPKYRRCEIEWIQSIADQCKAAGTPCFIKQDSHRLPGQQGRIPDDLWAIKQFPTL